jgi:hypothetical protein
MSIIDLNIKIPYYAKKELDRLIIKYSNKTLKGEYKFDKNSMTTLMIMTFDKSDSRLLNIDKIIEELKDELKEYYNK